jgi:hypothetical protein
LIRTVSIPQRLRDAGGTVVSASIVSAVDADTGDALDPGSFGLYEGQGGDVSQPPAPATPAGGIFTSPNAYASGTGLGPFNLPSILPASVTSFLQQYANEILIIAVVAAGAFLYSQRGRQ